MRHTKPASKLSFTESSIHPEQDPIIEAKIEVFGGINGLSSELLERTASVKTPGCIWCAILYFADPSQAIILQLSWD